tara:strand:+ start:211 stop:363 length:153 start_codon:yes stop_codon:yes gene_type:complete
MPDYIGTKPISSAAIKQAASYVATVALNRVYKGEQRFLQPIPPQDKNKEK